MVHKKYIKRDGKVFGPYLYENYREKGITKTRYLGIPKKKINLQVNLLLILGIIFLIFLLAGSIGFFVTSNKKELAGELASESPFDFLNKLFTSSVPVSVFLEVVQNLPPEFMTKPPEILVCENRQVDERLVVNDSEGDILEMSYSPGDDPPLFFDPRYTPLGQVFTNVTLYSPDLNWRYFNGHRHDGKLNYGWADYPKTISVRERDNPSSGSDYFDTNIVIIEVNDPPIFNIGTKTIDLYLKGEGSSFNRDIGSELMDNGEETPKGRLIYNLTYQNSSVSPFNISNQGVINIIGNESYIPFGNESWLYPLRICVNDTNLTSLWRVLHDNISMCWNYTHNGYRLDEDAKGYCDDFDLIITKKNRPPIITFYSPTNISYLKSINQTFNISLGVQGTDVSYFNLTAHDPDWDSVDVCWYVDNVSNTCMEGLGNNISNFGYSFGCDVAGEHEVKAIVTDGLLEDIIQWNVSVSFVSCSHPSGGGEEGGGGGKVFCEEKWGCNEWVQCQNLNELIIGGGLNKDTELLIKERCRLLDYTTEFCGLQDRICTDFNYCKTNLNKPPYIRECYYTENPNCTDNIRNCHNNSCEVLTDCGGPCQPCPTCNDKIKNQGETGIDCGGPCRICIELPWLTVVFKSIITYSLIALFVIILLLVARQIIKYTQFKRIFGESRIKNVLIRGEDVGNRRVKSVVMNLFFIFFIIALLFFANSYIINFGQANKIIYSTSDMGRGLLANYGFMNSIFSNFGIFAESGIFRITAGDPPYFIPETVNVLGREDEILIYDFKNNATEPEGEEMFFSIFSINGIPGNLSGQQFPWIYLDTSGVLTLNATIDSQAGLFNISVAVVDPTPQGPIKAFYFNISPVNDPPQFINLENKTFSEGDLFEYIIEVSDEEWDDPFIFDFSTNLLLNSGEYTFYPMNGKINISFIPLISDIGSYIINFSVMDNNSLGNKTISQLVNFTVTPAIWNSSAKLDYLFIEDDNEEINLTAKIMDSYHGNVNFSFNLINSEFPSFKIVDGIANFTLKDKDIGYNKVKITVSSGQVNSSRVFNFTVLNIPDAPIFYQITGNSAVDVSGLNVSTYENADALITLYIQDDDFLIPLNQKSFYDENLTLNLTIEGINTTLFNFVPKGLWGGTSMFGYLASFEPKNESVGSYNITINITDKSNLSIALSFNLTILSRNYDKPNIIYPDENISFNMKENITSNLIFRANHTVGDDLNYSFYIDNILRISFLGNGNNSNVSWNFAPSFADETYENETKNLTLIVSNHYYSDLFEVRSWNLTIEHTNCPPIQIDEIEDKGPVSYPYEFRIDLMNYFYDADYYDSHYNSTPEGILKFNVISNSSDSKISIRFSNNSVYIGAFAATVESLNINVSDNEVSTLSNNFTVTFVPPNVITIPSPSPSPSPEPIPVPTAFKLIVPGQISAREGDNLTIPLKLVNSGSMAFNSINLSSSLFKNSSLFKGFEAYLDKTYVKVLNPKQEENLTLTLRFGSGKAGIYDVVVNATSQSPKYTDWGTIHIELISGAQVMDEIIFTQEFIASNPQCIEITEVLKEAEAYFQAGDYVNAKLKTNEALNSCKEAINQVSLPKRTIPDFIKSLGLSMVLFLVIIGTIVLATVSGLIYYFIRRNRIENLQDNVKDIKERNTKI